MKTSIRVFTGLAFAILIFLACKKNAQTTNGKNAQTTNGLTEADQLLATAAQQRNVSKEDFMKTLVDKAKFTAAQNVFFPSALAVDFTKKWVTLPVYQGIGPSGKPTYFIMTESADFEIAKLLGVNYAPKLINGRGTAGSQQVTIENGMIKFKGDVDFTPVRSVTPGPFPNTFPPATAQPGSVGDAEYSPACYYQDPAEKH